MTDTLTHCPMCRGELRQKNVDKILRGGHHTAIVNVPAQVCPHCGERVYTPETIHEQLQNQDVDGFKAIGQTFEVV